MKITIKCKCCGGLPEFIEFKDKDDNIQNLKLEDLEESSELTYICNDAYFLGTATDDYGKETDYIAENIQKVINNFEFDIEYSKFIFEEGGEELYADVIDDESSGAEKKLKISKTEVRNNETEEIGNVSDTKEDTLKDNGSLYPSLDECDKFSMSIAEIKYYEKKKMREKVKEREKAKEKDITKAPVSVPSLGDEMEL